LIAALTQSNFVPFVRTAVIGCDFRACAARCEGAQAEIREHCLTAARKLAAKSLRSWSRSFLESTESRVTRGSSNAPPTDREIQRVAAAERALRERIIASRHYVSLSTKACATTCT